MLAPTPTPRKTKPKDKSVDDDEFASRVFREAALLRPQLTEDELRRIREFLEYKLSKEEVNSVKTLLKQDDRVVWFWGTVKTWAVWVSAVVAAFTIGGDTLVKITKYLFVGK